jgi:ATP-dependent RNA helicase DHX36
VCHVIWYCFAFLKPLIMLILTKRFAPLNPRSILPRYTCPSRWRLLTLSRSTGVCRFQSTASAQHAASKPSYPPAVVLGIKKEPSQTSTSTKKQKQQASMDMDAPKTPRPKGAVPKKGGKPARTPKVKAIATSTPKSTSKSTPKSRPKVTSKNDARSEKGAKPSRTRKRVKPPKIRQLTAAEYKQLEESRKDVYNFCARSLTVPIYHSTNEGRQYTVQISHPAGNISGSGRGGVWEAELQACIQFKEAMEENNADMPDPSEGKLALDTSNAEQFLRYYGKRHRSERLEEKVESSNSGGVITQATCAGETVGNPVTAKTKKEAMPISWLTAAVQLAQQNPSTLHDFQHAERGNDGEILSPLKPINFNIVPDMLRDMEASSRTFLRSTSVKANRASSIERSWDNSRDHRRNNHENMDLRNADLLKRHEDYKANPDLSHVRYLKDNLPMNQRRDEVLQLINNNTFSIVVGATGSGKTTQVPQIILEDAIQGKRGADIDIICTQPRRIAAKSVAVRVASERSEAIGDTVGYHVKGENKASRASGRMTYCTTGILLKQLQTNPHHVMDSVSHIIIDEVHERDILIDFLMITLKKTVEERLRANKRVPNVVLMSATMDTELFANYFEQKGQDGALGPCPSIFVPGRTFPVQEKYLDQIMGELKESYSPRDLRILEDRDTRDYLLEEGTAARVSSSRADWQSTPGDYATDMKDMKDAIIPVSLVAATIAHITQTTTEGAILAFLPGLQEIVAIEKLLLQNPLGVNFSDATKFRIFKLHSALKDNQDQIFEPVPEGCRKIIISTNIAETSVTIPDVQHVVDSGKLREKRYNQIVQITKLQCVWVSKSNMRQRAGRAGRVQNGNYYALYSKSRYDSLETIGLPEILRSDLMEVCLDVKAHSNYNIGDFLASSIQPPNPAAVDASVQDLKEIEAITETEDLTPLGKLLASLPVHPSLGKMIVLGVIFRCLDPLLILGASANERSLFARPLEAANAADRAKADFGYGLYSDPLTTINAFREARHSLQTSGPQYGNRMPQYFTERYLHYGAFKGIDRTMREIETLLGDVGVIPRVSSYEQQHQCGGMSLNTNSNNISLIRALTLAGQRGNLAVSNGPLCSTQKESRALIHRSSLNSFIGSRKRRDDAERTARLPSPPILSFGSRHLNDQNDITIRDTSLISPLIATLFGGDLKIQNGALITVGDRMQFYVKSDGSYRATMIVKQFRDGLDALLSNALSDLAEQKMLADDPTRDQFARALAHIVDQDFKLYMTTGTSNSMMRPEFQGRDDQRRNGGHRFGSDRPRSRYMA